MTLSSNSTSLRRSPISAMQKSKTFKCPSTYYIDTMAYIGMA